MKYSEIYETYINGNISDFKQALKSLDKYQLVCLMEEFIENGMSIDKVIRLFLKHLE